MIGKRLGRSSAYGKIGQVRGFTNQVPTKGSGSNRGERGGGGRKVVKIFTGQKKRLQTPGFAKVSPRKVNRADHGPKAGDEADGGKSRSKKK